MVYRVFSNLVVDEPRQESVLNDLNFSTFRVFDLLRKLGDLKGAALGFEV